MFRWSRRTGTRPRFWLPRHHSATSFARSLAKGGIVIPRNCSAERAVLRAVRGQEHPVDLLVHVRAKLGQAPVLPARRWSMASIASGIQSLGTPPSSPLPRRRPTESTRGPRSADGRRWRWCRDRNRPIRPTTNARESPKTCSGRSCMLSRDATVRSSTSGHRTRVESCRHGMALLESAGLHA